mgnify:CR=1 FL=1
MGCQLASLLPCQASVTVRDGLDELFKALHGVSCGGLVEILSDRRLLGNLGDALAQLSESGVSVACDRV